MKIIFDQYYTSKRLAWKVVYTTNNIIGEDNITEYLEPSAGEGVFLQFFNKPFLAYDIEPKNQLVVKQDFLSLNLSYKRGRCIIGNPPYGNRNSLSEKFVKKATEIGDFISFILPISQLNNNYRTFAFDLIYSEDLKIKMYSEHKVHCCLNIFKRPQNGQLNKRNKLKLHDVDIYETRLGNKKIINYDIKICGWGASIGKEIIGNKSFAKELYIKINNDLYKDEIISIIKNTNWMKIYNMTATPNLLHWQIFKYLKYMIPELK